MVRRFEDIYARKRWATQGVLSGDGSRVENCLPLVAWLDAQADAGLTSVLDLGCGDLEWVATCGAVTGRRLRYYGIDIVPSLIAHHRRVYPWFSGEAADLEALPRLGGTQENPQAAEIVMLKDVLFHLCNGAAGQILMYVNRASWRRLLVGTHPGADNHRRGGLSSGAGMRPLDVEATGLIDGAPARIIQTPSGSYAVYERD